MKNPNSIQYKLIRPRKEVEDVLKEGVASGTELLSAVVNSPGLLFTLIDDYSIWQDFHYEYLQYCFDES